MPLIVTEGLCKEYALGETSIRALDDVGVVIEKGEFVSIMGPSGSGKSTFMNILGCLDRPTSGSYLLDDEDVSTLSPDALATIRNRSIGFVFQGFNLLSRSTALENVALPLIYAKVSAEKSAIMAREALKIVGLSGRENHRPNQLSGGQQQRVAIARALVNRAPLILADEPTGNLDTKTSKEIMELFVRLNVESGITLIVVTHEHDIAEYGRRVIRFLDGRVVGDQST